MTLDGRIGTIELTREHERGERELQGDLAANLKAPTRVVPLPEKKIILISLLGHWQ